MTSEERKDARRARRTAVREKQRSAYAEKYDCYERVIDGNNLIAAAKKSRNGVRWKASVQRYFMSLLRNTWDLRRKLQHGISVVQGFICFTICERGKTRNIRSVHFKERVAQRSLCDNALVPMLSRSLVYDNGASIKGKGIHFAAFRCRKHLQRYFKANGHSNKGWVLLIDFSGYFDNIKHEPIKEIIIRTFRDRRLRWMIWQFVKSFGAKSLGIGSQVSQILAVAYPNSIDHYVREVLGLRYSGRYMDDSYFIHSSREYLAKCIEDMRERFQTLGIIVNQKKTQIVPIAHFSFLKVRFSLTETGKVVMKPCRNSVARMRKKLKAFARKVQAGEMSFRDVICGYESWRGYQQHLNSHKTMREMDKLFFSLFGVWPKQKKKRKWRFS